MAAAVQTFSCRDLCHVLSVALRSSAGEVTRYFSALSGNGLFAPGGGLGSPSSPAVLWGSGFADTPVPSSGPSTLVPLRRCGLG